MPRFVALFFTCLCSQLAFGEDLHNAPEPLPPEEAAKTMIVPEGFHVSLFAGEPDVKQPIAFCIDDRGRLWVAEAYNYPHHGTKPGDRIVILEDTDGDGRFDKRKVFYDQLNYVTGIEVGFGGAWVMSPPYFYFIPDKDGDDRPDGEPEVLLDGFGNHANAHNLANGLAWGPDGWLYGTHGRTNWSLLGKPGTPEDERVRFDGGVYRYHPVRHVWEPFADGTTNPWGIDWNDFGDAFVCNCVNPHLFHVIPGAHYEPWRNRESSRYAYERIPTIADHLHFVGKRNVRDGLGSHEEDEAGGGHAHCGTMVYLGDNWPETYRNSIFMNNIHGRRINNDLLKRHGSGYLASHGRDLMQSQDPWFMGVTLAYGPDGAVFASDWSDTGECHSVRNTRKHTGRIYKIKFGNAKADSVNLADLSDQELVALQLHRNDWHVRHARRLLMERTAAGQDMSPVHQKLVSMLQEETDVPRRLRLLWALYVTKGIEDQFLVELLDDESEYLRAWAVRLLCENNKPPRTAREKFAKLAESDPSAYVRLYLASMMQRLPLKHRWEIAEGLASRKEDADDASLPLMVWYGVEPLVDDDLPRYVQLAVKAEIPLVRRHIARRVAGQRNDGGGLDLLVRQLKETEKAPVLRDLLEGMLTGLAGTRRLAMPLAWADAYARLEKNADPVIRRDALRLALIFDDPAAERKLRQFAANAKESTSTRELALQALVEKKPADLPELLLGLLFDPAMQEPALKGLAEFSDPKIGQTLLARYKDFPPESRRAALQTLASRKDWALDLLDAVEQKQIAVSDLSAYTARQLDSLEDERVSAKLKTLWGNVRQTPAEKSRLIAKYKKRLTEDRLAYSDRESGKLLFKKNCANCHKLFGEGGEIGPDITGAQRTNMDYLLENLIDPSAAVAKDFQMEKIATTSGRTITGLVVAETETALTVQTIDDKVIIPKDEIEERAKSDVSMMPDGVLEKLSEEEVRDLIGYLSGIGQPAKEP